MTRRRTTPGENILKKHTSETEPEGVLEAPKYSFDAFMKSWQDFFCAHDYHMIGGSVTHTTSMDTSKLDFSKLPPPTQNVESDLLLDMYGNESVQGIEFFAPSAHTWMQEFVGKMTIQEVIADIQARLKSDNCFPGFRVLKKTIQDKPAPIKELPEGVKAIFACALVSDSKKLWHVGGLQWIKKTKEFILVLRPIDGLYQGEMIAVIPKPKR